MNVILLGGSNSVMVNGLQKGIRLGIDELNARIERGEFGDCNHTPKSTFSEKNFSPNSQENSRILSKNADECTLANERERERERNRLKIVL